MKRFWDEARVAETEGGFAVLLDGRPMRLPGGGPLALPGQRLAEAVAAEWQAAGGAKGGTMRPEDVPLTRLAGTALERVAAAEAGTVAAIARYGETDLLCYRAENRHLAARQAAEWDPWLGWSARALDAPLRVTTGLMPVSQAPQALAALHRAVAAHDRFGLAALGVAVPALGSLVLGLAVVGGHLAPEEAHRLSSLEEDFQEEFWGVDPDSAIRRGHHAADVALAARLMALLAA
ncbi:ATP12 family chaperone protein [Falsiroseomonas selenitidurans]|uniref:Chaperone, ATP12 n=1 Tax=Falsiroseomonas selenitidurans TaxID=2716335 RepID=A0ABX1EA98_9PROT|nr:ATP12 family protein [Falsiroseomonas selenitidurans]NKC34169.1 chaperone, ATP12 [Falsiroseomonas selenitidurans]